jgi:hypothetical protein
MGSSPSSEAVKGKLSSNSRKVLPNIVAMAP